MKHILSPSELIGRSQGIYIRHYSAKGFSLGSGELGVLTKQVNSLLVY